MLLRLRIGNLAVRVNIPMITNARRCHTCSIIMVHCKNYRSRIALFMVAVLPGLAARWLHRHNSIDWRAYTMSARIGSEYENHWTDTKQTVILQLAYYRLTLEHSFQCRRIVDIVKFAVTLII